MKKISKKSLNSSFWRWYYGNLTCFSHEHMQTFGYMWSMLPIIQELYETKEEQQQKLQTYYPFFNTEPQIGAIVVGITAGLEEARANGAEEIDDEMINGIRAGLMGPLAGIGDSLIVGTYIPVLLGIALGFAEGGSVLGPLFYIVVWNVTILWFMRFIYFKGYELGGSAVEVIVGEQATAFRESVIVLGQVIVGAMAASWVNITTAIELTKDGDGNPILLQDKLDGAFPGILTMLFVLGAWWLMAKKAVSPIKVMLLMVILAFIGVFFGFFDPKLSY
ncbi:mannose/fructose/N-acetylgalactosamine-specific phosphotransferase system component IID [Breznakia sp. PF5-3]|uniref:PTS system mannose/fructose/sorbose family transporter subunit IID n=1 Tax=unclassified Breznakia TaxID=2623764 RepID=UPI0024074284|nr:MULTISPECIES: PTS system mannose/fructose/sorbose family transporter subunit IID [unclassified Breznakia]MDL2276426.1 PTS system mannose/fructose/sorbose family transporter subunit IID [Breznakia sp. OttesenSCG-928-G09]MDF9823812.1 mannose/fructose/N-acetylgalactosamine-specific phosphotransferase system component IID [Breznakia sp. PM6-1]MDF9834622.1 mannose/fructose/N-acetylgalactosamine-specific phosphotransferase system component IID [Breznakia sp. PF5-3]MDF9836761.1 mannose/fructose/N-a